MFIKRTVKRVGGKTYVNHLLVQSVATPQGPRHRVVCSLGTLGPAPREDWLALALRLCARLRDFAPDVRPGPARAGGSGPTATGGDA